MHTAIETTSIKNAPIKILNESIFVKIKMGINTPIKGEL